MRISRLITILSLSALLSACTGSVTPSTGEQTSSTPAGVETSSIITVTPLAESKTVKGKNDLEQTETTFSLNLTTSPETLVQLATVTADQAGALKRLSPSLYQGSDIVAAYEYYYAGGGFQVAIHRTTPTTIIIQKRETSEGDAETKGGCTQWAELASVAITAENTVTIDESASELQNQMVVNCAW